MRLARRDDIVFPVTVRGTVVARCRALVVPGRHRRGFAPAAFVVFHLCPSLSGQPKDGQNQPVDHARADAVDDHRPRDREDLNRRARDEALCLCQVNPKRFFYFPVEIRQEFFFPYYEASPGIHSPIISVRYLLFSPISIRPPSNTRTLSISRLITSGRYSVKA